MKIALMIFIFSASVLLAQVTDFEMEMKIGSSQPGTPDSVHIPIARIQSTVVFNWPPRPTICPVILYGDFILPKLNGKTNHYLIEDHVCQGIAGGQDSTVYDFSFIYVITNTQGQIFYMQVKGGDKSKILVHISSVQPNTGLSKVRLNSDYFDNQEYLANGKLMSNSKRRSESIFKRIFIVEKRKN